MSRDLFTWRLHIRAVSERDVELEESPWLVLVDIEAIPAGCRRTDTVRKCAHDGCGGIADYRDCAAQMAMRMVVRTSAQTRIR